MVDEEHGVKVLNFVLFLEHFVPSVPGAKDSNSTVWKILR